MSGEIRIVGADMVHEGLIVVFEDGTSVVFNSEFLYEHRESAGNYTVVEDPKAADEPRGSI